MFPPVLDFPPYIGQLAFARVTPKNSPVVCLCDSTAVNFHDGSRPTIIHNRHHHHHHHRHDRRRRNYSAFLMRNCRLSPSAGAADQDADRTVLQSSDRDFPAHVRSPHDPSALVSHRGPSVCPRTTVVCFRRCPRIAPTTTRFADDDVVCDPYP